MLGNSRNIAMPITTMITNTSTSVMPACDIYYCPVLGEAAVKGRTDYLGPVSDLNELPEDAYVGGDKPGNHDSHMEGSGNVVRKSGDVLELQGTEYADFVKACRP